MNHANAPPGVTVVEAFGRRIYVDVSAELERYDWTRPRWTSDKLLAASPFRYDTTPSFFVRIESDGHYDAGVWHDSGAVDDEWRSGGIVKLLGFLRQETYTEVYDYLISEYPSESINAPEDTEEITLRTPNIQITEYSATPIRLDESILDDYRWRSAYLGSRGISEGVQRLCDVGYDRKRQAVVIPWRTPDGTLGNVMYRSVRSKAFWYVSGGRPIRELVYGLNIVYAKRLTKAVICEAPIDAMSVMTCGIPAIAVGGTAFGRYKRDLIIRSPLEEVVIMADHDAPGQALKRRIVAELSPYMRVKVAGYPMRYKDANDALRAGEDLREYIVRARSVRRRFTLKKC